MYYSSLFTRVAIINLRLVTTLFTAFFLSACLVQGEEGVEVAGGDEGNVVAIEKISINDATYDEIAPFVKACKNGREFCVTICHLPPGNPANSKTMTLPLAALKAHLHHGGATHSEKDYIGACRADDGGSGGGDSSGDNGGGGSNPDPTPNDDIPAWCIPFIEIDTDCDGYVDSDGEPIF